jgi:hypothetical protein
MTETRRCSVLIALRKEYRRYALRMCWVFERRRCATRLVMDVPGLMAAERELSPAVIILDAALTEPRTADVIASLQERPVGARSKLILVDLPFEQEREIREKWPDVEIAV